MNKKTAIVTSTIVILATLFVNVIISSSDSEITDFTFSNIDALAEGESSNKVQCIESGTICIGIDKNGIAGYHPGLQHNPEL